MAGKFATYDKEAQKEILDQYEEDLAGGAAFWKPQGGDDNEIRVLPALADEGVLPYRMRRQHWVRGVVDRPFNCPRAEDEAAVCFLCDKVKELKASDDDEDKAKGEDLFAKTQFLYRIIDINAPKRGVQVYAPGKKVHKKVAALLRDKKDYGFVILDIEDGLNLVVEKTGSTQFDTEYDVRPRRNNTSLKEDHGIDVEKLELPDIGELCKVATNAEMKKAWNGEDDAAPTERAASRRRPVADDEPKAKANDDGDDPEAEERPRRTRREEPADDPEDKPKASSRQKAVDDDEPQRPGRRLASKSREDD